MRKVIWTAIGLVTLGVSLLSAGYHIGWLLRSREEVYANILFYVRMHDDVENGRLDRVKNTLAWYLMSYVKQYDDMQSNSLQRLLVGRTYFDSRAFQANLVEARRIAAQQTSNLIWIGPETER